jgi:hypothetical protein
VPLSTLHSEAQARTIARGPAKIGNIQPKNTQLFAWFCGYCCLRHWVYHLPYLDIIACQESSGPLGRGSAGTEIYGRRAHESTGLGTGGQLRRDLQTSSVLCCVDNSSPNSSLPKVFVSRWHHLWHHVVPRGTLSRVQA